MNNIYQNPYIPTMRYNNQQPSNGIIWVQGIEGAKAYQMIPNSNAILLDSDTDGRFYIKVSDNVGMCNLRIFKFEEITNKCNDRQVDMSVYITREEFENALKSLGGKDNGKQLIQPTESNSSTTE